MPKPNENNLINIDDVSNNSKYLKQPKDENLKLRIENAYLKEVTWLCLG